MPHTNGHWSSWWVGGGRAGRRMCVCARARERKHTHPGMCACRGGGGGGGQKPTFSSAHFMAWNECGFSNSASSAFCGKVAVLGATILAAAWFTASSSCCRSCPDHSNHQSRNLPQQLGRTVKNDVGTVSTSSSDASRTRILCSRSAYQQPGHGKL